MFMHISAPRSWRRTANGSQKTRRSSFATSRRAPTSTCRRSGPGWNWPPGAPSVGGVEEARHFDGGARFDDEDLRKLSAS